jgi:hypothetical protein
MYSIWNKNELLEEWKESIIVPIYKQADKRDCSNYRGISLLSVAYKIVSYILSWVTPNAEKINGNHQCVFGCNRPTADHMLCIGQIKKKKKKENTMK